MTNGGSHTQKNAGKQTTPAAKPASAPAGTKKPKKTR